MRSSDKLIVCQFIMVIACVLGENITTTEGSSSHVVLNSFKVCGLFIQCGKKRFVLWKRVGAPLDLSVLCEYFSDIRSDFPFRPVHYGQCLLPARCHALHEQLQGSARPCFWKWKMLLWKWKDNEDGQKECSGPWQLGFQIGPCSTWQRKSLLNL